MGVSRKFDTGATRDTDVGKHDLEGFLSPIVLERFAEYMTANRIQSDGNVRDSDNWQKGIPIDAYMKSSWRHFFDFWKEHRGISTKEGIEVALCALMFNVMGYLHEILVRKNESKPERDDRKGRAWFMSGVQTILNLYRGLRKGSAVV